MKRIVIAVLSLGLVLSGCAKTTSVGKDLNDFKGSETLEPSASPTPSKTTTKSSAKPSAKKSTPAARAGNKWSIVIRNTGEGYNPRERRVVVGDTVTFTNQDSTTPDGHSFTGYDKNNKEVWDSGNIKAGKSWTWTVDAPVGTYSLRCNVVPYIVGGPFEVLAG
ncbi:MAG TPA: hypothetical protein VM600_07355 [Actinomycetota bacterium]|nr:hypothetical protein [Actinomycetota bacterium]